MTKEKLKLQEKITYNESLTTFPMLRILLVSLSLMSPALVDGFFTTSFYWFSSVQFSRSVVSDSS